MRRICTQYRSVSALLVMVAAATAWAVPAAAQRPEVQKLFQAGSYDEAVEAAQGADPASAYLAAQALLKLEQNDQAAAAFRQIRAGGDESWKLVAESGEALIANDGARALDLAQQAVAAGDTSWAEYQLGLAASKQNDFNTAVRAFNRSIELKGDFAYAHYYAALAHQRIRQLSKAAEQFEAFLRLAPDAPERQAVVAIMRTLK